MIRMFINYPGRVIPKTQKMELDTTLLNTQHYKVPIKGNVEQSMERTSRGVVAIEKGAFGLSLTTVANILILLNITHSFTYS